MYGIKAISKNDMFKMKEGLSGRQQPYEIEANEVKEIFSLRIRNNIYIAYIYIYIFSALVVYTRDPINDTWTFLELAFKTTMTQMQLKKNNKKHLDPVSFFCPQV